ncbi:ABATE domain-containing protein [Pseudomonas viridiflava]|uniref:Protein containing a Zn-ribbon-like motif, RNA-binding n=1 Tax=Pseudomonas viridiflava TaxID=33069 RepID=A0A3M5PHX3_PSEVI|nr:ABATE domain-containing protein [Pseudomonas viridiflava]RMT84221.1 Protein containing a Zn-ribbon-like motif, RNA-binding [Pseudomonas viridiflava]
MTPSGSTAHLPAPLILADHPALDLLNTRMMIDGQRCDLLTSHASAIRWLEQVGLGSDACDERLLNELQALRESIEQLVQARLEGRVADPSRLNAFLLKAVPQLVWEPSKAPELDRFCQPNATDRTVAEIAFGAAQLLAEGDSSLLRKCESHDCSLVFYDRTKSHKRRWCSMALCGNRHKVAEFRKRKQEAKG